MLDIKYIVTFTQSGDSAVRMARLRPSVPMLAFTPDAKTQKRLALSWGVDARLVDRAETADDMVNMVDAKAQGRWPRRGRRLRGGRVRHARGHARHHQLGVRPQDWPGARLTASLNHEGPVAPMWCGGPFVMIGRCGDQERLGEKFRASRSGSVGAAR
ncbi:hypothetical protein GCM10025876_36590 [Demequina litorisediminis]|uniref:Pyruvate kinase C-terminal domain-containing protein n=1 Tax=Demequina litorisediminis TaxID=1849022 RepID=A0ABQ6IJG2_9MICO|nr:hypothetical protein GCM10025876_36590 [Demequina litorisediminis]